MKGYVRAFVFEGFGCGERVGLGDFSIAILFWYLCLRNSETPKCGVDVAEFFDVRGRIEKIVNYYFRQFWVDLSCRAAGECGDLRDAGIV